MRRRLVAIAVVVLCLLFLGGLGSMAWLGSSLVVHPPWYEHRTVEQGLRPMDPEAEFFIWEGGYRNPEADLGLGYDTVEIPAIDGSTLRGWVVPGEPGATAGIVAVHGAGADRREFLRHVPMFHRRGLPVVLFDCREHGISDGRGLGISLGLRESEDVSAVVAWARRELRLERVAVIGTSQGGASVILAAAADPGIDVVISENPFTSIRQLLADSRQPDGSEIPEWAATLVATTVLLRIGGLDALSRPSPLEAVGGIAPRPLLLLHGTDDRVIPVEHSRRLAAAAGDPVELWVLEGASHAALFDRDPVAYEQHVMGFLERTLLNEADGSVPGQGAPPPAAEAIHCGRMSYRHALAGVGVRPRLLVALVLLVAMSSACGWRELTDPRDAGPDFALQGEYAAEGAPFGAQVIALGDGRFRAVLLRGGLPGAGFDGETRLAAEASREVGAHGERVRFEGPAFQATLAGGRLSGETRKGEAFDLPRVERASPTLGAPPPEGAVVLFDGDASEHLVGKVDARGYLEAGAVTLEPFGDLTLHLEYRTPFMPTARGQMRGNSGVYLQRRYEVQVLDSFGLDGADNEAGGIYQVAPPRQNMALPPLAWQTYDIEFRAARFDGDEKVENARVTVRHNGVLVHEDQELPGPTGGGEQETPDPKALLLQDHGNAVVYRNVWVVPR